MNNWLKTTIMWPHERLPPLVFWGGPSTGKTFAINFLTGYLEPFNTVVANCLLHGKEVTQFHGILENAGVCLLFDVPYKPFRHLNGSKTLTINKQCERPYQVTNYTHWIVESNRPVDGAINVELKKQFKADVDAVNLGRQARRNRKQVTFSSLRKLLISAG